MKEKHLWNEICFYFYSAEAKKLKDEGVKIIIALGHSGYNQDQIIAQECPEVDIVIGGHSHSFLYTGPKPPNDQPESIEGPYPTFVTQKKSGKHVPVVQAYAFTKYLGKIHVKVGLQFFFSIPKLNFSY